MLCVNKKDTLVRFHCDASRHEFGFKAQEVSQPPWNQNRKWRDSPSSTKTLGKVFVWTVAEQPAAMFVSVRRQQQNLELLGKQSSRSDTFYCPDVFVGRSIRDVG